MAWVATDRNEEEWVYEDIPVRGDTAWYLEEGDYIELPKGSIKKLIGRDLTWDDEPVELKADQSMNELVYVPISEHFLEDVLLVGNYHEDSKYHKSINERTKDYFRTGSSRQTS